MHGVVLHHHAVVVGLIGAELAHASVKDDREVAELVGMLRHAV